MKKNILIIISIFLLTIPSHFMYNIIPNNLTAIFFPVNESIWEHMKLLLTPTLIVTLIEYFKEKKKDNNFLISNIISIITSIIIYLIIYLPIDLLIGHNIIISISLLLLVIIIQRIIQINIRNIKEKNIYPYALILTILTITIFASLTFYPPKGYIFLDKITSSYGINHHK